MFRQRITGTFSTIVSADSTTIALAPSDTFVLTYLPDEDTIQVYVDGVQSSAWSYDPDQNAVVMDEMPGDGAHVEIFYDLLSECG